MAITINGNGTVSGITAGLTAASLPTGAVLQVLQTVKTDHTSQALTGVGNFFDVAGMSVAITPSSTSNKILVVATVNVCNSADGRNNFLRLRRDSTDIGIGTAGGVTNAAIYDKADAKLQTLTMQHLDSPSTTSATTYKVRWSGENSDTYYLNRSAANTNEGASSHITVMEIAA